MTRQRLQKVLAAAGVDSRRNCEQLIVEGLVCVNGRVVDELPAFVDPQTDVITVSGRRIRPETKVYYLLNKPKGVICTNHDPQGRTKAVDLVDCKQRIFCVGRLDADTTGLILLTNDSELANKLAHPRYKVPKTYLVKVRGRIDAGALERLRRGIWLAEGRTGTAQVKVLGKDRAESVLEITLCQGLNRQVRRMLAKVDLPVKSLTRIRIGSVTARGLTTGKFRPLSAKEIASLAAGGAKKR